MKLALLQLNSGDDMAKNIATLESLVKKAAKQGAELIATPENTFLMAAGKLAVYTQAEHPGVQAAKRWAKEFGVWLLIGSIGEKIDNSGKLVNRSLLINPKGNITATYDKIHLFNVRLGGGEVYDEAKRYKAGSKAVLAKTPFGKLGMTVCYDVRFPHLYRALAKKGAEIISVPSAFTQTTGETHWHVLLRARAIENGCYVIAPAQCGTHPGGRKTFGHSLIVDPWGKIIAEGGTETGVVMADIDLSLVKQTRARLPSLTHDRKLS